MAAREPLFGDTLDAWLQRLDTAGYHVGLRERLVVHDFLGRLRDSNQCPVEEGDQLRLLAPLLCTSKDTQRQYHLLLREFLALKPKQRLAPAELHPDSPAGEPPKPPVRWRLILAIVLLMGAVLLWIKTRQPEDPKTQAGIKPAAADAAGATVTKQPETTTTPTGPSTPIQPNSTHTYRPPGVRWTTPVRYGSWTISGLSMLVLGGLVIGALRRTLYLNATRSDREVEEKVLSDPTSARPEIPMAQIRSAARGLRQRIAGQREVLDMPATLKQTIRAAGAFTPRFRRLQNTPEYVALLDRRHPRDHFASACAHLLQALREQGVAVQTFYFEGSPEFGCWRLQSDFRGERIADRCTFAELSARHEGHRLLVFSEASALVDQITEAPRPWTSTLKHSFAERAWFTPMPLGSWGASEAAADALSFLILPAQHEALATLVGWLASDTPRLAPSPDWPGAFPALLQDDAVAWVARPSEPPAEVLDTLLFQLRSYLGPARFQWLCACAIFPAVSPPLTLALGRELPLGREGAPTPRELTLGLLALGALPFFRHGHLPTWLRRALLERLTPGNEQRYRKVIEQRLDGALQGSRGEELVRLAWLRRARGPARDVVMVEFLRRDGVTRLAQKLPGRLRQRLFRQGLAAHGLRPRIVACLAVLLLVSILVPLAWPRLGLKPAAITVSAFTNTLGMKFVAVPGTDAWFSIWETRVRDYEAFAQENTKDASQAAQQKQQQAPKAAAGYGSSFDNSWQKPEFNNVPVTPGPDYPVVNVSWEEAQAFCQWLTTRDSQAGKIHGNQSYRLPTDREWSTAVGLPKEEGATPKEREEKTPGVYPWGTKWPPPNYTGNYGDESFRAKFRRETSLLGYQDGFATTSPVGTFPSLENGLFDLSGNVWEWCEDFYDKIGTRVLRGGSWYDGVPRDLLSSYRYGNDPGFRDFNIGFRVVLVGDAAAREAAF